MTTATRRTLVAALAVLLTASSLLKVFRGLGWVPEVVGVVLAVAAAGLFARRLRVPALLQPAWGVLAAGAYVVLLYARDTLALGVVPTRDTAVALGTRIGEGLLDVEELMAPVPTNAGLVLLAVLGVAAIAVLVDLVAVALHRPAGAGLLLLVLLVVPSGTLEGGVGWLPFVLGAAGWLGLLMVDSSDRVGRWGTALSPSRSPRGAIRADETSLGRVGRRIGVAALGVAVIVPALLPGLESRLLDGGAGSGFGGSRTTTTYNPITELGGQLRLPEPRDLLAYRTTDPQPDYLRLTTLDRFDDSSGWSSSELSADVRDDAVSRGIPVPDGVDSADVRPLTTAVRVLDLGGPWLPVPTTPTKVDIEGAWLWDSRSETVFSTRTDVGEIDDVYRVTATRVLPSVPVLRRDGRRLPSEIAPFAEPPPVSDYVRELTDSIAADVETGYDEVVAIQAYFRGGNGFRYSEDASVPGINAPNALELFLRGRQGFCEQYASAMAAMVRLRGLPARVAVGFTPGTRQDDGTYRVTTSDAHAWPEVWFADHGWLRFEPTPRSEQVTTPGYTAPAPESEGPDAAAPQAPDPATQPTAGPDALGTAADRERLLREEAEALGFTPNDSGVSRTTVGLGVLGLVVLLGWPATLAALRRRRRWVRPGPHAAWEQICEDAVDVGHRWRPADSPRTAVERLVLERSLPAAAEQAVSRLAVEVERARYARPGSAATPVDSLHRDVATVHSALLSTARRRARWTARLAPPSTLRWASSTAGSTVADGLDRMDELVSSCGERLRRLGRRVRSA